MYNVILADRFLDRKWACSSMVEQIPLKDEVEGSNPSRLTTPFSNAA